MKIAILWFFIIAGLVTYSGKIKSVPNPGVELSSHTSFKAGGAFQDHYGAHGWIAALLDVSFSFGGFESANCEWKLLSGLVFRLTDKTSDVLSEVKDPMTKLKRSSMAALTLVIVSYIMTNISFVSSFTENISTTRKKYLANVTLGCLVKKVHCGYSRKSDGYKT